MISVLPVSGQEMLHLLPEWILLFVIFSLILADVEILPSRWIHRKFFLIAGTSLSIFFTIKHIALHEPASLFYQVLAVSSGSAWLKILLDISAIMGLLSIKPRDLSETGRMFHILLFTMLLGSHFMLMARNLLMLYLAMELVSISAYVMVGLRRDSSRAAEASTKYLLFGATSSALMLYGISWFYGLTGSLDLWDSEVLQIFNGQDFSIQGVVWILLLAGILFKIGAAPFHFWLPDIYQANTYSVTLILSLIPKIAGAGVLLTWSLAVVEAGNGQVYVYTLGVLAIMSLLTGNLLALWQRKTRRLMAYAGIGHAGFWLAALIGNQGTASAALLFYLSIYVFMTAGFFLLASHTLKGKEDLISDWSALGKKHSLAGICAVVFLIALIGIPPSGGFIAKWYVFVSLFGAKWDLNIIVLCVAVLMTVVSIWYYFSIIRQLYFSNKEVGFHDPGRISVVFLLFALVVLISGLIGFDHMLNFLNFLTF